jgi:hypothetical protein
MVYYLCEHRALAFRVPQLRSLCILPIPDHFTPRSTLLGNSQSSLATIPFRFCTYKPTPRFARLWPKSAVRKSFRIRTSRIPTCNPFRIRTYEKEGDGECQPHKLCNTRIENEGWTFYPFSPSPIAPRASRCHNGRSIGKGLATGQETSPPLPVSKRSERTRFWVSAKRTTGSATVRRRTRKRLQVVPESIVLTVDQRAGWPESAFLKGAIFSVQ